MQDKNLGMTLILVGLGAIAFALVVGLTKEGGGVDWISIITACRRLRDGWDRAVHKLALSRHRRVANRFPRVTGRGRVRTSPCR